MDLSAAPIFAPGTKVVEENCDSSAANTQDDAQCRSVSGSVLVERSAASGKIKRSVRKNCHMARIGCGPMKRGFHGKLGCGRRQLPTAFSPSATDSLGQGREPATQREVLKHCGSVINVKFLNGEAPNVDGYDGWVVAVYKFPLVEKCNERYIRWRGGLMNLLLRMILWIPALAYTGFLLFGPRNLASPGQVATIVFFGALLGFLLAVMFTMRQCRRERDFKTR